jgi:hypothetical protein
MRVDAYRKCLPRREREAWMGGIEWGWLAAAAEGCRLAVRGRDNVLVKEQANKVEAGGVR